MLSSYRISVLLLLLLLVMMMMMVMMTAVTKAQSGDEDGDLESRISCTSHITTSTCTLTCNAEVEENDNVDDEDGETDVIEEMKACYTELNSAIRCVKSDGDTIRFTELSPVIILEVTFRFKSQRTVKKRIDLKKIVKPRSPQVWNVTFHLEPYEALIHVVTPYRDDYLTTMKQLFQLHIWTAFDNMTQNISSLDKIVMRIDETHLKKNTKYQVKVRAIPNEDLQGTWSEWSQPYNFSTPRDKRKSIDSASDLILTNSQIQSRWETHTLIVCLVLILVVTLGLILTLKHKIITYVWPSIPHPKKTILQICNPNTGLLLNVKPEVFSVLNVYSSEKKDAEPVEESEPLDAADADQLSLPSSLQSSDCSTSADSNSTEDLELSALLSRSSSDDEGSPQSVQPPGTPQSEQDSEGKGTVLGESKHEEAYVTMSSFYQINKSVQKQ
uniref:Class I helical cytokine receptor number 11 n=1 Tax=Tetraodon nigroviridis TaxID=99883 RepID=Q6UAP5_TETNG|nr:class I helical cytokine receptor number 11 [Tetraodon nigroviridis]